MHIEGLQDLTAPLSPPATPPGRENRRGIKLTREDLTLSNLMAAKPTPDPVSSELKRSQVKPEKKEESLFLKLGKSLSNIFGSVVKEPEPLSLASAPELDLKPFDRLIENNPTWRDLNGYCLPCSCIGLENNTQQFLISVAEGYAFKEGEEDDLLRIHRYAVSINTKRHRDYESFFEKCYEQATTQRSLLTHEEKLHIDLFRASAPPEV